MFTGCSASASGSRRSCAAIAINNALNSANLVAAVVSPEHQAPVAAALRKELAARDRTRVVLVEGASVPRLAGPGCCDLLAGGSGDPWHAACPRMLRELLSAPADDEPPTHRGVVIWSRVDEALAAPGRTFDRMFRAVAGALMGPAEPPWSALASRKGVLIGSERLLPHLDQLCAGLPAEADFRYILIR